MSKPRKNTDFFCLVIYLLQTEADYVALLVNLHIIWEKMEIRKRNTCYGNIFCTIFFIYAAIGDNTPWEDTCSKQPIKTLSKFQNKYHNIKSIITISQYLKYNHKWTIWQILLWSFYICSSRGSINILFEKAILQRISHRRCSIKIDIFKNFPTFIGKHLCQSLFFDKNDFSTGVPVNFAKFLKTPFLQSSSRWLLLIILSFREKHQYLEQNLWE